MRCRGPSILASAVCLCREWVGLVGRPDGTLSSLFQVRVRVSRLEQRCGEAHAVGEWEQKGAPQSTCHQSQTISVDLNTGRPLNGSVFLLAAPCAARRPHVSFNLGDHWEKIISVRLKLSRIDVLICRWNHFYFRRHTTIRFNNWIYFTFFLR